MNKIIIVTVSIFIIVSSYVLKNQKNDTIIINYSKTILNTVDKTKAKNVSKINDLLIEFSKNISYSLLIRDHESYFEINKQLHIDDKNEMLAKLAGSVGGTKGLFYINKRDSIFINEKSILDKKFNVLIEQTKWNLTKETKQIDNYKCFKATRIEKIINSSGEFENIITAWFTTDLPNFYGPAGYFGLPGTILELDNGKIILKATKIEYTKSKNTKIKAPNSSDLITEKEFQETAKKIAKERSKSYKN